MTIGHIDKVEDHVQEVDGHVDKVDVIDDDFGEA